MSNRKLPFYAKFAVATKVNVQTNPILLISLLFIEVVNTEKDEFHFSYVLGIHILQMVLGRKSLLAPHNLIHTCTHSLTVCDGSESSDHHVSMCGECVYVWF